MKRFINYMIGLNILVLGVTLNTRSLLGVAAFSTFPYALNKITPMTFGTANIILYFVLIILQLIIERKMKADILLEIPFSFIMGYIIDLYQMLIPASLVNISLRILYLLLGNTCTAFGIYTMLQSHLVMAPVDGLVLSISRTFHKDYGLCKNCFDITMILTTLLLCLVTRNPIYGIGIGTIFSAFYNGRVINWLDQKQLTILRSNNA